MDLGIAHNATGFSCTTQAFLSCSSLPMTLSRDLRGGLYGSSRRDRLRFVAFSDVGCYFIVLLRARGRRSRALLPEGSPPPVERLAAGGKVRLRRADALQKREGALAEHLALGVEPPPRVVLLARVGREVVELRLVVGAAQDQGTLARCNGKGHVIDDPARLGVHGGGDLTLRQVQRPRAHHERPVLFSRSCKNTAKRISRHRSRQATEPHELKYGRREVRG